MEIKGEPYGNGGAEVTMTLTDGLTRFVWRFTYHDHHQNLKCSFYALQKRLTKRHKFRNEEIWSQHNRRANDLKGPKQMSVVKRYAKSAFMKQIKVTI